MFSVRSADPRYVPLLLLSAAAAVAAGTSVYLFDRDWSAVQFLAPFAEWQPDVSGQFGSIGDVLPSLTHAYAFALLIMLALWPAKRARQVGAFAWLLTALGLESLQSRFVQEAVAGSSLRIGALPGGDNSVAYILNGRFDALDLLAAALGVCLAYLASSVLEKPS